MSIVNDVTTVDRQGHDFQEDMATLSIACRICGLTGQTFMAEPTPCRPTPEVEPQAEEFTQAEQLGLLVGAAYGAALAERDEARSLLADALILVDDLLAAWPSTSWAADSVAETALRDRRTRLVQAIETAQAVDSEATPTQEDPTP